MREVNFKLEIGQEIKDSKRDLIIVDREIKPRYTKEGKFKCNDKWYKYKCLKCGNEDWIVESSIFTGAGCNTCCFPPIKIVLGFNTIWDKARWMYDLGVSEEDAKKYAPQSNQKIIVKCPNCSREKEMLISNIYRYKSICCSCGDEISYPEKFVINLLDQLNIEYLFQFVSNWSNNKRYDFYFEYNDKKYIIETHGSQHYVLSGFSTPKEEQQNDQYKKELALKNNINYYIELDCRKSNVEWIRNSIINSELNSIFDLSQIDWLKCEEFALSNMVKEICNYWRQHYEINNEEISIIHLCKKFKLNRTTIRKYLDQGTKLGWCNYNTSLLIKNKRAEILKDGESLGIFSSSNELSKKSEELFGVRLSQSKISLVANGKKKQYKGFTFRYVEN